MNESPLSNRITLLIVRNKTNGLPFSAYCSVIGHMQLNKPAAESMSDKAAGFFKYV